MEYDRIEYTQDQEEITATLYRGRKIVGMFDILGDWEDETDIRLSLHDEAERQGYVKVPRYNKRDYMREYMRKKRLHK